MTALFEVQNLVKRYGGRAVVDRLSFSIQEGEIVGLLGPNGAGKTTAFYMAVGLISPDGGDVYFKGDKITALPMHERSRRGLGYLAQEPSVFRDLSVEDNLLCILETQGTTRKERSKRLEELLGELNLTSLRKQKAGSLSGGERRRLEITRALITQPSLLLLDEPFANIDPLAIAELGTLIRHLKQKGISVLITDHNAREIGAIVDRGYLMRDGTLLASGTMEELLTHKEARRSYFGEAFKI